ncbi:MAG: hypothetical protein KDD64_08485 [Bdellovibrionales bacterium]|nr:hypothetical protein [Bdellovibrionales bacterium]
MPSFEDPSHNSSQSAQTHPSPAPSDQSSSLAEAHDLSRNEPPSLDSEFFATQDMLVFRFCERLTSSLRKSDPGEGLFLTRDLLAEHFEVLDSVVLEQGFPSLSESEGELQRFFVGLASYYPEEAYAGLMLLANRQFKRGVLFSSHDTYMSAHTVSQLFIDSYAQVLFGAKAWALGVQSLLDSTEPARAESVMPLGESFSDPSQPLEVQTEFWFTSGLVAFHRPDFRAAREAFGRASELAVELQGFHARETRAKIFLSEARAAEQAGEIALAQSLFRRNARATSEDFGAGSSEAFESQEHLVRFYRELGDFEKAVGAAEVLCTRGQELSSEAGESASALLALCLAEAENLNRAEAVMLPLWQRALTSPAEAPEYLDVVLQTRALIAEKRGDQEDALLLRHMVLENAKTSGDYAREEIALRSLALAEALSAIGRKEEAEQLCDSCIADWNEGEFSEISLVTAYHIKGALLREREAYEEAVDLYLTAQLFVENRDRLSIESSFLYLGCAVTLLEHPLLSETDRLEQAIEMAELGFDLLQRSELSNSSHALPFLDLLSRLYDLTDRHEEKVKIDTERQVLGFLLNLDEDSGGDREAA